jgi:hypothetical protein
MAASPVRLAPRRIVQVLAALVTLLVVASVIVQTVRFATGDDRLYGLVFMFSLGAENNPAAYYSTLALFFTAALLAVIGRASAEDSAIAPGYWLALAAVFVFLSADEMLGFHERLIEPVRSGLNLTGSFYYAWVIPYGAALLIFAAFYVRFLIVLPRRTAMSFVLAGALFVSGAIGLEMVGGSLASGLGTQNAGYVAVQTLEEMLEMVGILIFIHALLEYADQQFGGLRLDVSSRLPVGSQQPRTPQDAPFG